MSSVAPRDAEITYVNGAAGFPPRLAERIARARAITLDVVDRFEDEPPANDVDAEPPPREPAPVTLFAVPLADGPDRPSEPGTAGPPILLSPITVTENADEVPSEMPEPACARFGEFASDGDTVDEPSAPQDATPVCDFSAFNLTLPDTSSAADTALADLTDQDLAAPSAVAPAGPLDIAAAPAVPEHQPDLGTFGMTETAVPTDARAIEAARQLVSLIAEQRTLLEAIQRTRSTGHDRWPGLVHDDAPARSASPAHGPEAPSRAPFERAAAPAPPSPSHLHVFAGSPGLQAERPPMIIERAQAAQRAGIAPPAADVPEPPHRLASFAMGFGFAMIVSAAYWGFRSIV